MGGPDDDEKLNSLSGFFATTRIGAKADSLYLLKLIVCFLLKVKVKIGVPVFDMNDRIRRKLCFTKSKIGSSCVAFCLFKDILSHHIKLPVHS